MLFKSETLGGIKSSKITLAFRRWKRPAAKAGGRQRTALGVLAIDKVERVEADAITTKQAKAAGYANTEALLSELRLFGEGDIYRIEFHLAGEDPRIALRDKTPAAGEIVTIHERLAKLDAASRSGPWVNKALGLIKTWPARRAPELAGLETVVFKRNIRKLKELGLTESLEIGYRLSLRGAAVLKRLK